MSTATRHPFRREECVEFQMRCRFAAAAAAKITPTPSATSMSVRPPPSVDWDVCCVQGSHCSASARVSIVSLVAHLTGLGVRVLLLLPDSLEDACPTESLDSHDASEFKGLRTYETVGELRQIVTEARPACIVLSSHDPRFESLRRDPRTIRWTHEVPRCFDPQASRCSTPLWATNGYVMQNLPGYVGVARPFQSWDSLDAVHCVYTPGPIRVLGTGNMADPQSNFKAFQALAEKYRTMHFAWHGATRNKRWANMEFCTCERSFTDLLSTTDILLWTADNDPCPLLIFEGLYLGARVWLFEKSFRFQLAPLSSNIDGSALLSLSVGAPQHAPLHTASKNPKHSTDVQRARDYVRATVSQAPDLLVSAVLAKVSRDISYNEGCADVAPGAPKGGPEGYSAEVAEIASAKDGPGPQ